MSGMPHETIHGTPIPTCTTNPWQSRIAPLPTSRYHHPAMNERPDPVNKIGVMAEYVAAIYHAYVQARATQLIYCETVMVYAEIRRQLVERGIPDEQIAFIQDYDTKARKAALYAAMNSGRLRVLLASKQSTGMNIQQRLIALHHLDCPWRPGDLEQREGRIVRQGNRFPEVMIFAFVTEGSFDAYRWQTIHTKSTFIEQMKRGDVSIREMDDLGDAVLSASEIKAIASGNPLVMAKVKLDMEVQKLEAGEAGDRDNRVRMRRTIANNELERQRIHNRLPFLAAVNVQVAATSDQDFTAAILDGVMASNATAYTKREAAGEALLKVLGELDALAQHTRERQTRLVGRYRGFELNASASLMGTPDLQITWEYAGETRIVGTTTLKSAGGAFQSIGYLLNHIDDEIARAHARLRELEESDQTCTKLLAEPWPQEAQLAELRERRDRINAELSKASETPTTSTNETPSEPTQTPAQTLVVTAESDADHITTPVQSIDVMARPVVVLPTPENREAMAAAIRTLSGAVIAAEQRDEPAEQRPEVASSAVTAPSPIPAQPENVPVMAAVPIRSKQPIPLFGVGLTPARKAKPAPLPALRTIRMEDINQLDLFGSDMPIGAMHAESGPAQISMF